MKVLRFVRRLVSYVFYSQLIYGCEVSLAPRPPFTPHEVSWFPFKLEAEYIPGPRCGWKDSKKEIRQEEEL
jgi:hypothetical protein